MILCVGTTPVMQRSMIFQRVQIDAVNRAAEVLEYPSGKVLNVARVAQALGEEVTASGFLGGDSGRFIREQLNAAGVAHDFVTVGPRTRMCITVIDRSAGTATELVEESRPVEPIAWEELRERVKQLLDAGPAVMVLSGSLPPRGPEDFYGFCVAQANARRVRTILDATSEPLIRALSQRPTIVKPNRSELAKARGVAINSDADLRESIDWLLQQGPSWAVVSEGKAGVVIGNGEKLWRIRSPEVKTVSPIGSGDALAAGLACALARGETMPHACRLGVACGAANATNAIAGLVRREDVESLLGQIQVESWS
jgi:tagatose 6-phosphate kinase